MPYIPVLRASYFEPIWPRGSGASTLYSDPLKFTLVSINHHNLKDLSQANTKNFTSRKFDKIVTKLQEG